MNKCRGVKGHSDAETCRRVWRRRRGSACRWRWTGPTCGPSKEQGRGLQAAVRPFWCSAPGKCWQRSSDHKTTSPYSLHPHPLFRKLLEVCPTKQIKSGKSKGRERGSNTGEGWGEIKDDACVLSLKCSLESRITSLGRNKEMYQ